MEITRFEMGALETNTYLLKEDNKVILIDPACKAEKMIEILGDNELIAILLTHGHFDHIKAVDGLYKKYRCPVYLHSDDEYLARDKNQGASFGIFINISSPTLHIEEGIKEIGPFKFEVLYTPGHTEGSLIYIFDKYIFTGDTLFKLSVGRTDLEGGNNAKLNKSLKLFNDLDREAIILPGHGEPSILGYELDNNPYLY